MIGLHLDWQGASPDTGLVNRFTRSLAVGIDIAVGHHRSDGALFAAQCAGPGQARGWRPAVAPCGTQILFDGYLDNADTLRRDLRSDARDPATLYALGYARWADAVDLRAIGQFATIAVRPGERQVRVARSPLQAPPLHVWHDRDRVIIASTARILFAGDGIMPEIDEQKIADSLYLNYKDEERGWYRGVRRIGIGAQVIITPDGMTSRRYYDIAALPAVRLKRDTEYVEAANALLLEGTKAALQGFDRPAISLSGGLDSQAVAASAVTALGSRPLLGLTGVPEAGWDGIDHPAFFGDETAHVAALSALYPTLETETIDAAGLSFDHKLPAMFLMAGTAPRNTMNLHWIHALRARAKARGCDVLLLGAAGNFSFSFDGRGAHPGWLLSGRWRRLVRELNAVRGHHSLVRSIASHALLPLLPDGTYRRWTGLPPSRDDTPPASWCPLDPAYAREMNVRDRARALGHDISFRAPRSSRAARAAAFAGAMREIGDIRQGLDLIHGIPSRDPTAYRPLVEFCIGIPDDQYLRDGESRWLARRMLRGKIPDMVLNETRRGRQAADWAIRIGRDRAALIDELDTLARDPAMARRLDLPRLRAALAGWSPQDAAGTEAVNLIQYALPRAIATARFIRFVEGSNVG
ncbi:MAG: asparagine synthetase B family protein [Pseudomonadota bacterium]